MASDKSLLFRPLPSGLFSHSLQVQISFEASWGQYQLVSTYFLESNVQHVSSERQFVRFLTQVCNTGDLIAFAFWKLTIIIQQQYFWLYPKESVSMKPIFPGDLVQPYFVIGTKRQANISIKTFVST